MSSSAKAEDVLDAKEELLPEENTLGGGGTDDFDELFWRTIDPASLPPPPPNKEAGGVAPVFLLRTGGADGDGISREGFFFANGGGPNSSSHGSSSMTKVFSLTNQKLRCEMGTVGSEGLHWTKTSLTKKEKRLCRLPRPFARVDWADFGGENFNGDDPHFFSGACSGGNARLPAQAGALSPGPL
jgi:hypothetical protein